MTTFGTHKGCGGRVKSKCVMAFPGNKCSKCGATNLTKKEIEKKKPRDPERQRKLTMIASVLGAVFFLALAFIAAGILVNSFLRLGDIATYVVGELEEAKTLEFPKNETQTAMAISTWAFLLPINIFLICFILILMVWCGGWAGKLFYYFHRSYTRRPTEEDLNKFLEELYVREAEKKKR